MAKSLEEIISKEPVQQVEEPEVVEEVVEEPTEEPVEEPTEVIEDTVEEPATTAEEPKTVPLAGLLDERDKRKEAQAERDRLAKELEESKKQPIEFDWENPNETLTAAIDARLAPMQEQFTRQYIDLSRQMTKEFVGEGYDAAEQAFADAAKQNPVLVQNALESGNPGKYMYTTGKQMLELDAAGGDVNAMREQIRAEERAKLLAEMKQKDEKLSEVPESLTETQSASTPREKVEGGPTPLENILPNN